MSDYVAIGIVIAILYLAHQISKVYGQNQDIAFRVNKLLEHQGIVLGKMVEPSSKVRELAIAGAELEAIKAYRQQSGVGLKEARAVVRSLAQAQARAGDA